MNWLSKNIRSRKYWKTGSLRWWRKKRRKIRRGKKWTALRVSERPWSTRLMIQSRTSTVIRRLSLIVISSFFYHSFPMSNMHYCVRLNWFRWMIFIHSSLFFFHLSWHAWQLRWVYNSSQYKKSKEWSHGMVE